MPDCATLIQRTLDAPTATYFGESEWTKIVQWLIEQGWTEQEVEAILYSKYMKWSLDHPGGHPTCRGFQCFYETSETNWHYFSPDSVNRLVDERFPPANPEEMQNRLAERAKRPVTEHELWVRRFHARKRA